jgi:hypothetical protein
MGDAPVSEGHQVLDGGHDAGTVVDSHHGPGALDRGGGDHHGREAQRLEQGRPVVVDTEIGEEDAVDPAARSERLVVAALGLLVGDHLQKQGLASFGQGLLDAGDEGGEERVCAERLWMPGDHQPDGQCPRRGQRPRLVAGGEPELGSNGPDPVAGGVGDSRAVVQGERDGTPGDSRRAGDVRDRGASCHAFTKPV